MIPRYFQIQTDINPFHATGLFIYSLKTILMKETSELEWARLLATMNRGQ